MGDQRQVRSPFTKNDAHAIEFNVPVKPGEERKLSFTVLYTKLPARNDSQERSDTGESEMLSPGIRD